MKHLAYTSYSTQFQGHPRCFGARHMFCPSLDRVSYGPFMVKEALYSFYKCHCVKDSLHRLNKEHRDKE